VQSRKYRKRAETTISSVPKFKDVEITKKKKGIANGYPYYFSLNRLIE
jgi:hypothetical protein